MGDGRAVEAQRRAAAARVERLVRRNQERFEALLNSEIGFSVEDAVDSIAHDEGEHIPWLSRETEHEDVVDALYERATAFFENNRENPVAQAEFAKRGLDADAQVRWQLGYAPNERRALTKQLLLEAFPVGALIRESLTRMPKYETYTLTGLNDFFFNRVMIPVHTEEGVPAGFFGRIIGTGEPKFLRSSAGSKEKGFSRHKQFTFFNVHRALDTAKSEGHVYLAEGIWDAIGGYENGTHNIIANVGTSMSGDRVQALARLLGNNARAVRLMFDPDLSGYSNALTASALCNDVRIETTFLRFPDGMDPDEYILSRPGERRVLDSAPALELEDFVRDAFPLGDWKEASDRERGKALQNVAQAMLATYKWSEMAIRVHRISEALKLPVHALESYVFDALENQRVHAKKHAPSTDQVFTQYVGSLPSVPPSERVGLYERIPVDSSLFTPEQQGIYRAIRECINGHVEFKYAPQPSLFKGGNEDPYITVLSRLLTKGIEPTAALRQALAKGTVKIAQHAASILENAIHARETQ